MNRITILTVILIFFLFASCDNVFVDCENYDYSDCDQVEPADGELKVELTINNENQSVPVVIYKGNFEDRDTILDTLISENQLRYYLPVDRSYSVAATYFSGNKTIVAVDGDRMEKKSRKVCSATCWRVKGNNLDVRLKY
jgi:hypothetical protein